MHRVSEMELVNKSNKRKNKIYVMIFIVLSLFLLLESLRYHKKTDHNPQKREISSDRAGYWVYSLMWFEYGFQSNNYPNKLDSIFDYGFSLDQKIIKNKYTCGVAYLQAPFYLVNKGIATLTGRGGKPTSTDTRRIIDVAGIFYLLLAAIFLYFFLIKYVPHLIAFASICVIVAGTNVFFYAVYQPGMSHIYSFFLFSAYLFVGDLLFKNKKTKLLIPFVAIGCMIFLIRPTDILFLPVVLFLRNGIKENIRVFLKPVSVAILFIVGLLIFIPQMHYWYIYSGKFIYYSYENEGFTNWLHPNFRLVLFPPENGLFPYSLFLIILLLTNLYAIFKKQAYAVYFLLYQVMMIYLIASWHCPDFAAGYGQRNFVQVFAGYSFILAFTFDKIVAWRKKIITFSFITISLLTILMNQRIIYKYDQAYFGWHRWDWREYFYYLSFDSYVIIENFDELDTKDQIIEDHTKNKILNIQPGNDFSIIGNIQYKNIPFYFKKITFSMKARSEEPILGFDVYLKWMDMDSVLQSKMLSIQVPVSSPNKWAKLSGEFRLDYPDNTSQESSIILFIHNIHQRSFVVDNIKIVIH